MAKNQNRIIEMFLRIFYNRGEILNEFLKNIISVKLKHQFGEEYILDIVVNYDFHKELFSDNNLIKIENKLIDYDYSKGKLYYKKYKYNLYKYGFNDEKQWWSSRTEVINKEFNINIHECLINNCVCGIDKKLEKYIIEKFIVRV